jgi:hypothetical protein
VVVELVSGEVDEVVEVRSSKGIVFVCDRKDAGVVMVSAVKGSPAFVTREKRRQQEGTVQYIQKI